MGNIITEKYFDHEDFSPQEERALKEITEETGFQIEKEIFRGKIYDSDKVGSLIYQGQWENKPAVLKIQGLKPEIEETQICQNFEQQNRSQKIRLPKIYQHQKWQEDAGYGYLILEHISTPPLYTTPFTTAEDQASFLDFYQEYKTNCLNTPLFPQEIIETNTLVFSNQRVNHWAKIAQSKKHLTPEIISTLDKYLQIIAQHLPSVKMQFMHGHLTGLDIFPQAEGQFIIMSNLFWSYRPEFYDTTFHLWRGLNALEDPNITSNQIIQYLDQWETAYQQLSVIKTDPAFSQKFNLMMLERFIGSIIVDLHNKNFSGTNSVQIQKYRFELFQKLFAHYSQKLNF